MSRHDGGLLRSGWRAILACLLIILSMPVLATAQTTGAGRTDAPKWEISVQAGGAHARLPREGYATPPDQLPLFTTVNGTLSRTVPSWFFAYGASLLNQVVTQGQTGIRLATADNLVFAPSSNFDNSWTLGVRVSRTINPRFAIEGSFDYSRNRLGVTDAAKPVIDATISSFAPAWNALLATDPATFQNVDVSATSVIDTPPGHQVLATGALVINILTRRQNTPYVLLGTGVMSHGGTPPSVTLVGHVKTLLNGTAPIDEIDTMTLRYDVDPTVVTVTVGAGWKHMIGARWGIRGEVREQLSGNPVSNLVTATPGLLRTSTPAAQGAGATNRFVAVQFSNIAGSSTVSSLSSTLSDFQVFHTTGMESRFTFTGGIFWRF
jgi:hypothetical protein